MIDLSGYRFEKLHLDREFVVSRGRKSGGTGSVLLVTPNSDHSSVSCADRINHVLSLKAELESTWATCPLEVTGRQGVPALVLDDPGGEFLDSVVQRSLSLEERLRLSVGITIALRCIHARGLIHRDIKPSNYLVDVATGEAWLTGFSLTSRVPRQRQSPEPPEAIAGTLAYMAPEQTGRMNRSVDSRSDLYSLGVTLYEIFAGGLPFTAHDPMEWVHCHIARVPLSPSRRRSEIPDQLSAIILKLLAKAPEERYQTASGVEADLRQCLSTLKGQGRIDSFPLGTRDVPSWMIVPEKLYGREREVGMLLSACDRVVTNGHSEIVFVSGYSGIGKSSVVNELHKALVPSRGLFASGKVDQYRRDVPYATLAQAFQGLLRQILSRDEAEIARWRDALREALGQNGDLVIKLIPEVELIIGAQPSVADLPPQEAQARFQSIFRRFIGVFARPDHPLALFLDDLQWLDAATLKFLEHLVTEPEVRHVLFICAYRDNEVGPNHPLTRTLNVLRSSGAKTQSIILQPLTLEDVASLLSESLRCELERVVPLASLVFEKTGGNPFFTIQFISELEEENLLAFDPSAATWQWDVERVRAKGYTDNVVDLMVGKLSRFPDSTQNSLKQLACLGNCADFGLLQTVYGDSKAEIHEPLWEAVRAGLVFRSENSYRFLHDRVQEAAYSLIPHELRAQTHLRIGTILAQSTPQERLEETIFDIVNQLNRASSLLTSPQERERLAEFNRLAGRRAQASSAYESALNYLVTGAAVLTEGSWQQRRELRFALELARAQCEFASGAIATAEERLRDLSVRAVTTEERVSVACLQVDLYQGIDRSDEAVAVGLRALRHLGVDLPERPTEDDARSAFDGILTRLGSRAIEDLINLPLASDPDSLAALDLLIRVAVPGHFVSFHLFIVAVCTAVSLGLERGQGDASCIAYVQLGTLAGPVFGQFDAGYRFGRLGCDLVERPGLQRFQARAFETFGFVVPWTQHVRKGRDFLFRGFDLANQSGEISYAGYACGQLNTNYLMAGDSLLETQEQAERGLAFTRKVGFGALEGWILGQLGLIRSLRGLTNRLGSFDDGVFSESDFERDLANNPALTLPGCWYYIRKLQAHFFAGEFVSGMQAAAKASPMLWMTVSLLEIVEYHFYDALCHAAAYDCASPEDRKKHLTVLAAHQRKLDTWALHCPENFANRAALVRAEVARIEGRDNEAMSLYEEAIRSAREHGFVQNEGVAYEVAARFYEARCLGAIADAFRWNAKLCYVRWGADGKVQHLDRLYPHLDVTQGLRPTVIAGSPIQSLDVVSVVKASQALSSEILLPKLIERLMKNAVENAGAQRGLLILPSGNEYLIQAEARASDDQIEVTMRQEPIARIACPESLIRYVIRTRESVILDDASRPNLFSDDGYLRDRQSKSLLCLPLIKQRELTGILLLENALTSHAFTPARIAVLELLAAQAAISLENTRLYNEVKGREARIRRLVEANIIGIHFWTLDGGLLDANEAFLQMVGYSRDDLVLSRVRWTDLTPPEWRDRDKQAVEEIKTTGAFRPFEKEYLRKDGTRVPVLLGGALFETSGNEGVAFILDLSEQKRAESAMRLAQSELAHVSRITTLGELTASIAHEVNQPLGSVVNNANACLTFLSSGSLHLEEVRQALEEIIGGADRASAVISRIRNLAKKMPYGPEVIDLSEIVAEVLSLVRHEATTRQVQIQTNMASDLPHVQGDRIQLQQVLLNLVVNGMEAMATIEPSKRAVVISGRRESHDNEDWCLITVQDAGPGVKPDEVDRLFETFYTTKPQGMGMGLAISRSIIEFHGGKLWAETEQGSGAKFLFRLPTERGEKL